MRRAVALLAASLALAGVTAGCGDGGAEPGAPIGATLMLDFTPNPVHAGIFAAASQSFYKDAGVDLKVQVPGESTDAPKLLAAGRADFAILDIHDLGIAREKGLPLVGVLPIVHEPLAAIIARRDRGIGSPRDLEGRTVGVTGLPSDEAVVDSEVSADGGDPAAVDEVTIGFNAISALAAGKVDAATAFWNVEGVTLRLSGVPIRVFKVDRYGAPPYPELILTTTERTLRQRPQLVKAVVAATERGYRFTVKDPEKALEDLLAADPSLVPTPERVQLNAVLAAIDPRPTDPRVLREWAAWDLEHGLLQRKLRVNEAFALPPSAAAEG